MPQCQIQLTLSKVHHPVTLSTVTYNITAKNANVSVLKMASDRNIGAWFLVTFETSNQAPTFQPRSVCNGTESLLTQKPTRKLFVLSLFLLGSSAADI